MNHCRFEQLPYVSSAYRRKAKKREGHRTFEADDNLSMTVFGQTRRRNETRLSNTADNNRQRHDDLAKTNVTLVSEG